VFYSVFAVAEGLHGSLVQIVELILKLHINNRKVGFHLRFLCFWCWLYLLYCLTKLLKSFSPDLQGSPVRIRFSRTLFDPAQDLYLLHFAFGMISIFLMALTSSYERFHVVIPAGWEILATQSLVIIRTTNREFDSELFINKWLFAMTYTNFMENLYKINTFHFHHLVQYTKAICRQGWSCNLLIVPKLFNIVTKEKVRLKAKCSRNDGKHGKWFWFAPRHLSLIAW